MPTYRISAPDGNTYSIEGPEGASQDDVIRKVLAQYPESGTPIKPRKGVLADVMGSATNLVNIGKTGIAALTGDSNAAAQAGLERQKQLQQKYESGFQPEKILAEYDKGNYLSAAGEALSQVPSAVAGLLPSVGQEFGLAAAGRLGGGALGALIPIPGAAAVGATVGQYAVPFVVNAIQALGGQAQEKAQEQLRKGEQVDVDVAELVPYASANAALNLVGTRIAMPSVFKKAIGQKVAAEAEDEARLALMKEAEKVAGRGKLNTIARGALGFAVGELPTEILQDVVDRAAVGKPLTDEDAMQGYRITALNMVLGAPLGGAVGLQERSGAQTQVALQEQKDRQAKAVADAQARAEAAAAEQARRQTPEFAVEAQTRYNTLLAQKAELDKVADADLDKNDLAGQELKRKARAERKALLATDEAKTAIADWNASKANLPPAPPVPDAPITSPAQLRDQPLFPELPGGEQAAGADVLESEKQRALYGTASAMRPDSRQAELQQTFDLYDQTVGGREKKTGVAETQFAESDPRQQARALEGYLNQLRVENKNLPVNAYEKRNVLAEREKTVAKALDVINSQIPKPVDVAALRKSLDALHTKIKNAADLGDVVASERYSSKAKALEEQIANATVAPSTQQEMELLPFTSTVTGNRQLAVRNLAPAVNLGAEEQEADVNALTALGQDNRETPQTYAEKLALLGMRKPGSAAPEINAQLGLFGPNDQPELAPQRASAALGQMKQTLTGEDITATGPSEKRGIIQRGGKAPFNLYPRREGTEEPVTAEALRQRIYDLGKREDLTPEAAAFLRRVEPLIGENDTTLETDRTARTGTSVDMDTYGQPKPGTEKAVETKNRASAGSFFTLLDEQLRKIEAGAEGITPEGFGKPALYQGFPVETRRGLVTTPTAAESQADLQKLKSGEAAKALAKTRAKRYQQGIADGESPAKAAYNARLVVQPDEEAMRSVLPQGQVPVQKRGDATTETTLRGPSGRAKPLAITKTLESQLRLKESLVKEDEGQLALFPEEQAKIQPIVRATAANFQKFLDSKTAAAMRDNEKASNKLTEQLPQATKVFRKISEIEAEFNKLSAIKQKAEGARNTLAQNEAAMQWGAKEYGKLMADPMFVSLLNLTEASRSEKHAGLLRSIAIHEEIATAFGSKIKEAQGRVKDIGKRITSLEDRVRLDMLNKQVLEIERLNKANQSVLDKLNSLKDTASAASAAVEHIQAIRATLEAQKTLQEVKDTEPTTAELKAAQAELVAARAARIVAEQNSRAQSTLRDTRDRSYATRRKADEISAARTRAWNVLSQLPSTKYRALTPEERKVYQTAYAEEVPLDTEAKSKEIDEALKYEQQLAGMNVQSLKMELGIVEKAMRELEVKINEAKAKSIKFLQAGEKLAMYGPKGSPFTKPAFVGIEGFLKKQAALAVKLDTLEKELAVKEAAATPISKGARGEEVTRTVAPATSFEADEVGMAEEKAALYAIRKEAVNNATATLEEAKKEGDKKAVALAARALIDARNAFAETVVSARQRVNALTNTLAVAKAAGDKAKVADTEARLKEARNALAGDIKLIRSRTQQLVSSQTAAPSKMRTGSAESRALPGVTKKKLTEAPVNKMPSFAEAVADANKFAAERLASKETLTKKEIKAATLAQQEALQRAAFDRLQTVTTQVANAQQKVDNLKQAQADYKAGRRTTFNVDVLNNANTDLEEFQRSLVFAREQAGVLEDLGPMSASDIKEEKRAQAAETKKGKSKADVAAQETEAAVSSVYAGELFSRGPTANPSTVDTVVAELKKHFSSLSRVKIYGSVADLIKANPQYRGLIPKNARGFVDTAGNKAFLIAENIDKGQALGVLLHEVGAHVGLKNILGKPQYNALVNAIQNWAKKNDGSIESRVAKAALARVEAAGTEARFVSDETLAYAIEEAIKAGIKPLESKGVLGAWLSRIANGFRKLLTKFGMSPESLDAQGLVDMAFGAAQMEMRPAPTGMSRRMFLRGAVAAVGGMKLPPIKAGLSLNAKADLFNATLDAADSWFNVVRGMAKTPALREMLEDYSFSIDKPIFAEALYDQDSDTTGDSLYSHLHWRDYGNGDFEESLMDLLESKPNAIEGLQGAILDVRSQLVSMIDKLPKKENGEIAENELPEVGDLLFSRAVKYGEDDALGQLAQRAVAQKQGWWQTMRGGSNYALEFEMQTTDMRAALRKVMEMGAKAFGDSRLFQQAMYSYTKADQKMPLVLTALSDGPLEIYEDAKGLKGIRSTGKDSAKDVFAAVSDIPDRYGDETAKMNRATMYLIAQRAANKGLAKLDLGALDITQQEVDAAMAAAEADPKLKAALESVRERYNAYNKGMIEFLADTGAITKAEARDFLREGDYVPYYRVRENGIAELVFGGERTIRIGDIRHQPHLAALKGGEAKILPINESIPRNTTLLVSKAMTNLAARNVGYAMQEIGKATDSMQVRKGYGVASDASIIRFNQEPDPNDPKDTGERHVRVQTNGTVAEGIPAELLIRSLEGAPLTLPGFLKWGGIAGDLLRAGVTRTPLYLMRQLFRDPMAATATAGLDYSMLTAIYKANKEFLKLSTGQSTTAAELIKKGLMQSNIFTGDPDDISKFALQLASGKDFNAFDKLFRMADKAALNADAATRALVYENAIKNGLSEVEAEFAVMESMNFYKRGLSPAIQYASRMIPFFNAQIQGLNVLYKAATGQMPFEERLKIKQKFYNNAMLLAAGGIAYAMAMEDDEYYKNAKPKDRYSNFFLHTPFTDEPIKLPIPYEFGWFFSLGAAAADAMAGQTDGTQQLAALQSMFKGAIPGASSMGVPQLVKPIAEVWFNKDFNTGFELESTRLRGKSVEERYTANTTELAKAMSKFAPILSPIQIERIVGGYLGQIPIAVMAATNGLFKDGEVEPVPKNLSEMSLIGGAFQKKYGGADADTMYRLADEALQAKRDFDSMKREGRIADAQDYVQNHRTELRVAPLALQYQKLMGNLRTIEERIKGSNIPGDEKRKRIDDLQKRKQDLAEKFAQRIKQMES